MISKKTQYALKAVLFLTGKYVLKQPVLIPEIAEKELIPKKFLEAILLELKKNGVLQSRKGKGGGYFLAKAPGQISYGDVIKIFENPFALLPCLNQGPHYSCQECKKGRVCGVRMVMQEIYNTTSNILEVTTFQEVYDRIRNSKEEAMYFI